MHARACPKYRHAGIRDFTDFTNFTEDNDPWGEHDFGKLALDGHELCWKIDYLDLSLMYGSPDPRDSARTRRLPTVCSWQY